MCTDRKAFLTMGPATRTFKKECRKIKCSDLCDILKVDPEKMTVTCEPLVDMGHLTRLLLPMGYALKIQIEMEDITIGGLSMGLGMETNSHRFGLIQETIRSYDVVLASGELVHATRENEHAELFGCLAWSCGTLGFLVAVEVELVCVKPYVRATYIPCFTQSEHCRKMKELALLPDDHPDAAGVAIRRTLATAGRTVLFCGPVPAPSRSSVAARSASRGFS